MNKMQYEKINGKEIATYFSTPEKECSKKIVVMSHGFRGNSLGPARQFVDFQKILNKHGYSVLRFDQPNSGNSEGDYINSSFNEWVNTTSFFAKKYISLGYKVALFGQSMGATTSVVAANNPEIKDKIECILLWVPDAKSTVDFNSEEVLEESAQKYKSKFWLEARNSDFFKCLKDFNGGIHLVYGEFDRYVEKDIKQKTIDIVKEKGFEIMMLNGQDHSPWTYDLVQTVYKNELELLDKYLN